MQEEIKPESIYRVGEQVVPKFGSHKGQVGTIIEIAWGDSTKEWMYLVKFVRAKLIYYDNELRSTITP